MIFHFIGLFIDFIVGLGLLSVGFANLANPATWLIYNARYYAMAETISGLLVLFIAVGEVIW